MSSYTTIKKIKDFDFIIQDYIYLSGKRGFNVKNETYNNLWNIMLSDAFIKKATLADLQNFFHALLKKRKEQIKALPIKSDVTFYMWVDELGRRLCFNLVSGRNFFPPTECTLNIVKTPELILQKFLDDEKKYLAQGGHILFKDMKFFEPGDPGFDDIDEPDPKDGIQDVYVTTITWKSLLKE